ncbi:MAG TPA: potassium/proton antiporter, partial [Isosphaeraceae bacterium]|nr:potassium/proton antiporter [Isosphaeraceae bacterium]
VLRSRNVSLKGQLKPLLELESGSNDPMAALMTIGLVQVLTQPDLSPASLVPLFVLQLALGAAVGPALGKLTVFLVNRLRLGYEGLYPVLTLALVLVTFSLTNLIGGNGFLAVYLAGIVVGNHDFLHKQSLKRFHDGMAWLMQIAMFLTLGLLAFPSQLVSIIGPGLIAAAWLMLVARPLSVFLCLLPTKLSLREKVLIAWVGLRGAVPIVLATYPLVARTPHAGFMFNVVFFVVLTSVLAQGTSIPLVARWLHLDAPNAPKRVFPLEYNPVEGLKSGLKELIIAEDSPAVGKSLVALRLPREVLVVLIARGNEFLVPGGGTTLEAGDSLLVLAEEEPFARFEARLSAEVREPADQERPDVP